MNGGMQKIIGMSDFSDCTFVTAPAPRTDSETIIRCRTLCRENTCGSYDANWGCPPGSCSDDEVKAMLEQYDHAVIVYKRYEVPDMKDKAILKKISKQFQNTVRTISVIARNKDIPNLPLADGGCMWCGYCSYPDPCRDPNRRVISISGMGIDMEEYLGKQGLKFVFEDSAVTLYGLILY